jgi:acyl carrier protein
MADAVSALSKAEIQERVVAVLMEMVKDWDLDYLDPVGAQTKIVEDLGFESVDLMQLMVAVEKEFGVRGLPYEQILMEDGGYVNEISVGQLVEFLHPGLNAKSA